MKKEKFIISVLLFKEENQWIAQGLEYDITAQGSTIAKAQEAFEKTVFGQILYNFKEDQIPFHEIRKAPKYYWDWFEQGERLKESKKITQHFKDYIQKIITPLSHLGALTI